MKERLGVYPIDFVLNSTVRGISKAPTKVQKNAIKKASSRVFQGVNVYFASDRYDLFAEKGCTCVKCGIEGEFFALEGGKGNKENRYHFNLYAVDENNKEVLMTKDHIQPKSKGGTNTLDNYQPMCERCNSAKKDNV